MPIKPLAFTALIKVKEVEEKTKSGIVLAVDKKMEERAQTLGTILALGEDFAVAYKPKTPCWGLKEGDQVFFAKYAGKWVLDPDTEEELLLVLDSDIVGKYVKDADPRT